MQLEILNPEPMKKSDMIDLNFVYPVLKSDPAKKAPFSLKYSVKPSETVF